MIKSKKLLANISIFIMFMLVLTGCTTTTSTVKTIPQKKIKIIKPIYKQDIIIPPAPQKEIVEEIKEVIIEEIVEEKIIENNQIAIVFPSLTIGKYALEATNSINTYLLCKNKTFGITTYDIVTQNEINLIRVFKKIINSDIKKIVALITKDELYILNNIENIDTLNIYLPLVNRNEVRDFDLLSNLNIMYGAINYKDQFSKLIQYTGDDKLAELYDNSVIGTTLDSYLDTNKTIYKRRINDNNGQYRSFLKNNKKLNNATIILNTPIVKSSILLSAISAEELNLNQIVSTQLNYTPLLFSLTQKQDRKKLIVANSIGILPVDLEEYNQLIGNNLSYSWVNYSSIVGVEYLLSGNIDYFKDLTIEQNQIVYPIKLYKVGNYSFELIK